MKYRIQSLLSNLAFKFRLTSLVEVNGNSYLHYAAEFGAPLFLLNWAMRCDDRQKMYRGVNMETEHVCV